MDQLSNVLTFVAALSVATERITEMIKRIPGFSLLFSQKKEDPKWEDVRVILVHGLAIVIGALLCTQVSDVVRGLLHLDKGVAISFWAYAGFGVLASGGSGFWNNAVDALREIKKQKESLRKSQEPS